MNGDSESHSGSGDTNPGAPGEQGTVPPTNHDLSSASQGASSPAGENTTKDGGPGNCDSKSNHSDTKKVSAEPTRDVRSTSHDTDSTSHDTELGSSDPTKDVCSTSHDTDSASHDRKPGSNETTKDSSAADHDTNSESCDERTTNKNESLAKTDVPVDTSVLSSRDTHGLNGDLKSSNHDSSVNRDHEMRIDLEEAESDTGKDRGAEAENARLLPNGRTDAEDVSTETVEAGISADETEVMEDVTEDFDGRLENLTQSILDLQGKSEAGAYFESVPYVRRRGINKYKPVLKTLIPVRGKASKEVLPIFNVGCINFCTSKEVLPISNVGCINFCTFGWVTPIVWKVYKKGVDSLKAYKLSELDSAETHAQR
ncbi:dentin sialophosphoprotein-like [Littorina saxatilis]|uniref:dentin sialophosphoprotein-like n=1 Tax=Littorina saxatilis TaxID=31220 RepID=UPI0038B66AE5